MYQFLFRIFSLCHLCLFPCFRATFLNVQSIIIQNLNSNFFNTQYKWKRRGPLHFFAQERSFAHNSLVLLAATCDPDLVFDVPIATFCDVSWYLFVLINFLIQARWYMTMLTHPI